MSQQKRRVVLAFFRGEDDSAKHASAALCQHGARVQHFRVDGNAADPTYTSPNEYSSLRLQDEELLVVEVESASVPHTVKTLRTAGEPGVFLTCPGLTGSRPDNSEGSVPPEGFLLLERLTQYEADLKAARGDLIEASRLDHGITEAGRWILDNAHLLRASVTDIRQALPRAPHRLVSKRHPDRANLSVLELARRTARDTNNSITGQNLADAVTEYQTTVPLSIAELWVYPVMLRFALIESLASLALRVSWEQKAREFACLWANRLTASVRAGGDSLTTTLRNLGNQPIALQPCFLICVVEQLQDEEAALVPTQRWIEAKLGTPLAELVRLEHGIEAASCQSVANAFGSLRGLSRIDFSTLFESLNVVERELRRDPAGTYPRNDFRTRDQCRLAVEAMARLSRHSELDVARLAIEAAEKSECPEGREVCWHLLSDGRAELERTLGIRVPFLVWATRKLRSKATLFFLAGVTCLTLSFLAVAVSLAHAMGVRNWAVLSVLGTLALFPLSELAIQIVNALIISSFEAESLPKLDFEKGIPSECATLVIVPMMLSSHDVIRRELEKLEVRFLANRDRNLYFGLFSDFTDSPVAVASGDAELVAAIRSGIDALNHRFPSGGFVLFHRDRVWSPGQGHWIGRERKRGKIEDLNHFLRGKSVLADADSSIHLVGELALPIRYVITLDADTQLPPGTARRMAATIAHPLNRPVLDPVTKVRRRGFGIIQPRVSIGLPGATASRFTRMFADTSGTDPYCRAVSDAQQDLFGEAIFHGKAIYDVEAFDECVGDRFPAETLLSHDLIEGSYVGVGLASDIELFENMPLDYASFCKRTHRWVRGDWQIASWILRQVPAANGVKTGNTLSAISRWRILDNLRRSLVPVASMLLLLTGWFISASPGAWSLVVGLAIALPAAAPLLERLARRIQGSVTGWRGAGDELLRAVVMIAFLPHQALLAVDAIGRVLHRRYVSHKYMLEWQTADSAASESRATIGSTMWQMIIISSCSGLLMCFLVAESSFAAVSAFVALWVASPALLYWLNKPSLNRRNDPGIAANSLFLRGIARQAWRFFDDLVGPATNWLPPDNSQVALRVEVANRTSPTNIGLWFCTALAARDFGYLTADELLARCTRTFETMSRLMRYEGHLLNWYDTSTLEPLAPRYVSTVDSGNLLASLWVFVQGVNDVVRAPILSNLCMKGLSDTLTQLESFRGDRPSVAVPLHTLRNVLRGSDETISLIGRLRAATSATALLSEACSKLPGDDDQGVYWAGRLGAEVLAWNSVADLYLKWFEILAQMPDSSLRELAPTAVETRRSLLSGEWSLETIAAGGPASLYEFLALRQTPGIAARTQVWLEDLERSFRQSQENAERAVTAWRVLAQNALEFSDAINMAFLYDPIRGLFGIGYLVGGAVAFNSHYDLLASECRLASLVAIAKGEVPLEHWRTLGRPLASRGTGQVLLSWSGTMFEYLMPLLFTRSFPNSLLDGACRSAVSEQKAWGRQKNVPWGVSECAWSAIDSNQIYQYHAFGIPTLSLKTALDEESVVAPYATMLSLQVDPEAAIHNLFRLRELGLLGPMGFYESIDFSRANNSQGECGVVVYTYMSHHQSMSVLALDNVLNRGAMQRRFHADRRIRAVEPLLFERTPSLRLPVEDIRTSLSFPVPAIPSASPERVWKDTTAVPRIQLYGHGRYSMMVTNSGGGYSRWQDFDITRWRSDPTRDCWGSFIYVRDLNAHAEWSTAWQPLGGNLGTSSVRFLADHAEFHRRTLDIETVQSVTVAAEDDAELRHIVITNWSPHRRELELTSYTELALAVHRADTAHPAFAKLFIVTEYLGDGLLIAHRRLRAPEETPIWVAQLLLGATGVIQYETDRSSFIGRSNSPASPDALRRDLNGSAGAVVDPIFALRCSVVLAPRDRVELNFITLAAGSREDLLALVARYRNSGAISQAFEMMWTRAQLQFRYLGIGSERAHRFQELASHLLYPTFRLRHAESIVRNRLGQNSLWATGISGDLPILTVTIADERFLSLVRELLQAHSYWRLRGFRADLVILNQAAISYDAPLGQQLQRLIAAHSNETGTDKSGGVFLRDWEALPEGQRYLLLASSSVVLGGNRGSLQQQLAGISEAANPGLKHQKGETSRADSSLPLPFLELPYFNGLGGFSKDGREYAIFLKSGDTTPAPWVNVMANPAFGAVVSESGLGFTWSGNSQMNRLTPWNNDPVCDEASEAIYLRDEGSGVCWSPTPQPIRERDAYRTRHGQGYTVFEHNSHGIGQELTVFVPVNATGVGDPVKIYRLRLRNDSLRSRKLSVTYFATLVLGTVREETQLHIQTSLDAPSGALFATQYRNGPFAGRVAFAACTTPPASFSGDRTQFLGRNRAAGWPAALQRVRLDNKTGVALDPAFALQTELFLEQGDSVEVSFLLGECETAEAVRNLISQNRTSEQIESRLRSTKNWWDSVLGTVQVKTPLLSVDLMLNRWLLYQSLSCRFWGRSALYQSGGAVGFRDQLQDSLAFVYAAPRLTRAHILLAASRQFVEGDVQHWWHVETGMGVRTRCSDDLVWLPFVVAQYVSVTGDLAILAEPVPFLEAPLLADNQAEYLSTPATPVPASGEEASLWEHCRRALDKSLLVGTHRLPLIGSGDWNDGLSRVGEAGQGESVWLAWFLASVLNSFGTLMERIGHSDLAARWRMDARRLTVATEGAAWDGSWYLRAFFDNGLPLGAEVNPEAKLDSLPQSWAVISGLAEEARARTALESAQALLVDPVNQLVRLFTPPFDHSEPHPGYIMGYPPGLRENGGQYTHGSLWMAMAWARLGDGNKATGLLTMMNPVEHTRTPEGVARYCGEPYAVAADVSAAPMRMGRAGWTWYTGASAWMYRIWLEEVLGFKLRGEVLSLNPVIPNAWPGFEIRYRFRSATYLITVERATLTASACLHVDGRQIDGEVIELSDDGAEHQVVLRLSAPHLSLPETGLSLSATH